MFPMRIILALGTALVVLGASLPAPAMDTGWSMEDLTVLASLRLSELPALPDDPSNAYQASAPAAALGRELFFDKRFSRNQAVACASCHDPGRQFQDGRPVGEGLEVGTRRSMPVVGAAHATWLFWDGRKDSLWSQALGPLEDPKEHGGNRLRFARLIEAHYRRQYVEAFGPLPSLAGLPEDASPAGSTTERSAWQALKPADREAVSRVFANIGKAIAAYERTLQHGPSRFDLYVEGLLRGDRQAMSMLDAQQARGLRIFIGKGQCVSCHNGPLLTDQQFHNTGVAPRRAATPDHGRQSAIARVLADEFNCVGPFSDAAPGQCGELRFLADDDQHAEGAFRTPGLRNAALRPPYMHAGQLATLEDVVRHYVEAPRATVGQSELAASGTGGEGRRPIRLSNAEQHDLVRFLQALVDAPDSPSAGR